jgi:hypothetical protein
MMRELQRGIQSQRKKAKLKIDDIAIIEIITDSEEVHNEFRIFKEELKTLVRAEKLTITMQPAENKIIKINEKDIDINVQPM